MSVLLNNRSDMTLEHFARVAWTGEALELGQPALQRIAECRECFLNLLDFEPDLHIYGVTSGYGQNAKVRLDAEARRAHAATPPLASMAGFGGELPERIKRGIVFSRMANFIEGHAAVSVELAQCVTSMLEERLPRVPLLGNSSAGEIVPLSHLFVPATLSHELAEKEALSLINGSPCAAALLADVALSTEHRLGLALDVLGLSIEALGAPLEAYDPALEPLYGDPCISWALQQLRVRINPLKPNRRSYQAPVSWRIVPQVLGQAARAHAQLIELSRTSLKAVTDNPVFIPPDSQPAALDGASIETESPFGRVLSNGGYHNAGVLAALDTVAGSFADLALLCDRQVSKLFDGNVSGLPAQLKTQDGDGYLGCIGFIAADYAEQAKAAAQRTSLIGSEGGGFGQNDVLNPVFHAWRKAQEAGQALDACLAILAVSSSQAFHVSKQVECPEQLKDLLESVRFLAPPVTTARAMGASVGDVADSFHRRVFAHCTVD